MNKIQKTPFGLNCLTESLEELVAVDDDDVCSTTITRDKEISDVQSTKNIIDADSDDKNEINNAASLSIPTSSKISNNMKSMRSYLDAHPNG
ncbi:hypothetical protein TNCV_697161 [Trichonephila clavipes]|nr:hypothetical protein TNCV_697161 [Trichonephila clavipes]